MLPYGRRKEIVVTEGNQVFPVDFPSRCYIDSIALGEVGGSRSFTIDVFTKNPDDFGDDSESPSDLGPDPENVYLFCPRLSVTAGVLNQFFDTPKAVYNFDAQDGKSVNPRKLYFRFNGIADGNFILVIVGSHDVV